jgi:DNA polymerase-3 subunit delta'
VVDASDQLPHALLLSGPPGVGKSRFAHALVSQLLCEAPQAARPCGTCAACGWVAAGTHPDLRVLSLALTDEGKPSSEIRIDQVRALADFLVVGSHRGGRRIVVIDPADAMNTVTANALLKTLEEPGDGLLFLLVTGRADALLPTIRSRCQTVSLPGPGLEAACAWIQGAAGCTPEEARTWLAMAGGAPLHALRLAEPASASAHRSMLEAIAGLPDTALMDVADSLQGFDARQWLPLLQRWAIDLSRCRHGAPPRYFPPWKARLNELSRRTDDTRLADAARGLAGQFRHLGHPLNPRLFCEESLGLLAAALTPTAQP